METVLSVIATILSVGSIVFSISTFFWTSRRDQKLATLEAYNRLQTEAFDPLNHLAPKQIAEIAKNRTSKEYKEVGGYIARIEHFCVGVNSRIYDRKTVYELANGYLNGSQIVDRISPIIDKKNSGDKDYYENTHRVIEWMNRYK